MMVFNARPYLRLFSGLMSELTPADASDAAGLRHLKAIGLSLYTLQPSSLPGFAFAWLELVSSTTFMPKMLMAPQQQGWALFEALLVALLRFLEPHLRTATIPEAIRALYKGTLRVLLVLLHDFPEFLCEHHFQL
jgi:CCR4-NOT transcription complex subunit 1